MKLLVERVFTCSTYTIGHLYIDGQYICDTIEDTDRGLDDTMSLSAIKSKKVYCETAIPCGEYKATMNVQSPKFSQKEYYKKFCNGYLLRLLNVPGFDGILLHESCSSSNIGTAKSSCGCIIVGYNKVKGKVINSREAFEKVMNEYLLVAKKEHETITVEIKRKYKV